MNTQKICCTVLTILVVLVFFVTVEPGVQIDVDVRLPATGTPPLVGWPILLL